MKWNVVKLLLLLITVFTTTTTSTTATAMPTTCEKFLQVGGRFSTTGLHQLRLMIYWKNKITFFDLKRFRQIQGSFFHQIILPFSPPGVNVWLLWYIQNLPFNRRGYNRSYSQQNLWHHHCSKVAWSQKSIHSMLDGDSKCIIICAQWLQHGEVKDFPQPLLWRFCWVTNVPWSSPRYHFGSMSLQQAFDQAFCSGQLSHFAIHED